MEQKSAGWSTFQSTLPARGATGCAPVERRKKSISIHAPRTGSDRYHFFRRLSNVISIHAPRTGSDEVETGRAGRGSHFNPRSPHGERRFRGVLVFRDAPISIHAPRTGSDESAVADKPIAEAFQSTLPARGATPQFGKHRQLERISIHAPRTGSDARRR